MAPGGAPHFPSFAGGEGGAWRSARWRARDTPPPGAVKPDIIINMPDPSIDMLFAEIDTDDTGSISYWQFLSWWKKQDQARCCAHTHARPLLLQRLSGQECHL